MKPGASALASRKFHWRDLPTSAAMIGKAIWRYFFATSTAELYDRGAHRNALIVSLVFVVLPLLISPSSGSTSNLTFFGVKLPPACISHILWGTDCPGCGMTRAFVSAAHGEFRQSLQWHRLGLLLYVFFVYQIGFRLYCLRRLPQKPDKFLLKLQCVLPPLLISLLILNWGIGLALGGNGS